MVNLYDEINKALPELANIRDTPSNREFITRQGWNSRIKGIATRNLKKYHKGLSWVSLLMYFNPCIVSYHDSDLIEFNKDKYKLIRQWVTTEQFNQL